MHAAALRARTEGDYTTAACHVCAAAPVAPSPPGQPRSGCCILCCQPHLNGALSLPQCLGHTYVGDFALRGADLRKRGLNRIGNMLVPNSNYCKFEDWVMPLLDAMLEEQQQQGTRWTPSKVRGRGTKT